MCVCVGGGFFVMKAKLNIWIPFQQTSIDFYHELMSEIKNCFLLVRVCGC